MVHAREVAVYYAGELVGEATGLVDLRGNESFALATQVQTERIHQSLYITYQADSVIDNTMKNQITVHSLGRWGAAIDWDAAASLDYTDGQYLSDVRISSSAIGSALAMSRIDHSGVSLEVSLSDSRGMEQFLATNALSWEHTDSSSDHVTLTSYYDPQRARLHGPSTLLSNTSHSEAHLRMDKGM